MNHLPFENWIFEQRHLTSNQVLELEAHLKSCQQCRELQNAWRGVEKLFEKPSLSPAPPQFVNRFQMSLAQRKANQQKRQIRMVLLGLGGNFILLFIMFVIRLLWSASPAQILSSLINWIILILEYWSNFQYIVYFWGSQIPPLVIFLSIVLLSNWSILLLTLWLLTVQRLSPQGVQRQ